MYFTGNTLTVTGSTFKNILGLRGPVMIVEDTLATKETALKYTVSSNTFENNIAYSSDGGAGLYLLNPKNVNVVSNTFRNNRAINGEGGGVQFY